MATPSGFFFFLPNTSPAATGKERESHFIKQWWMKQSGGKTINRKLLENGRELSLESLEGLGFISLCH